MLRRRATDRISAGDSFTLRLIIVNLVERACQARDIDRSTNQTGRNKMKRTMMLVAWLVASLACGAQQPSPQKSQSKAPPPFKPLQLKPSLTYESGGKLHTRDIPSGTFDC